MHYYRVPLGMDKDMSIILQLWCRRHLYTPPCEGDRLSQVSQREVVVPKSNTDISKDIISLVRSDTLTTSGNCDADGDNVIDIENSSQADSTVHKTTGLCVCVRARVRACVCVQKF